MAEKNETIVKLTNVRIAFPNIFTAQAPKDGRDKAAFSASFLMPPNHPDVAKIRVAIAEAAKTKWGDRASAILPSLIAGDKVCLHNGETKAQYDGYAGNMFVSSRGYQKPIVLNNDKTPLTEADGKPYSGCYVNAQVAIWGQDNQHGKRVNAQLRGVQFLRDGEAFGGGGVADVDDFDTVDDSADAEAPTAGDGWGDLMGGVQA